MDREILLDLDEISELIPPESKLLEDDFLICECFCVSAGDIRDVFPDSKNLELELVKEKTNLGHGCQGCLRRIDSWFNKIF